MFHYDQKEEFVNFIFESVGKHLKVKSTKLFQRIHYCSIKETDLPQFIEIMNMYGVPYKTFKDEERKDINIKNGNIGVTFLIQYPDNDEKKEKVYNKLEDEVYDFPKDVSISSSVTYDSVKEFDEITFNSIAYFVIDSKYEDDAENIVKHVLGIDIQTHRIDVSNDIFDINGLVYFEINNKYNLQNRRFSSYELLCELVAARINHCIYIDRDGELQIDLRMKEHSADGRKSEVKFRNDLKEIFYSTWEANFARILNHLSIEWEFEKDSFHLDTKQYTGYYFPDYFLPNNVIIEIKGFWDLDSINKVNAFKEMYPEYKLLTIDGDMFFTLEKMYQHLEHWETMKVTIKKEIIPVVGIQIPERKKYVAQLKVGEELLLERDANNPFDGNAIKVLNNDRNLIGYMAKEWASIYAEKLDIGMTFYTNVLSKEPKVIKVAVQRNNMDKDLVYDFLNLGSS